MQTFGVLLIVFGAGSALFGLVNIAEMLDRSAFGRASFEPELGIVAFGLVLNWGLLVLPGLLLMGVGTLVWKRGAAEAAAKPGPARVRFSKEGQEAPVNEPTVECSKCGRQVPESQAVRFLGKMWCPEDYEQEIL